MIHGQRVVFFAVKVLRTETGGLGFAVRAGKGFWWLHVVLVVVALAEWF